MAASGKEARAGEVCREGGLRQDRKETLTLLTQSATLTKSSLPEASMSTSVRPPFHSCSGSETMSAYGSEDRSVMAAHGKEETLSG
jgi:hypothetical protein